MPETHPLAEFRTKFRVEDLLVAQTGAWSWSVRPDQPTLGGYSQRDIAIPCPPAEPED